MDASGTVDASGTADASGTVDASGQRAPAVPDREPRPRAGRGRVLAGLALSVLVAAGVVLLIGRFAGLARVLDELRAARPWWLAVCLAAEAASFAGYTLAFREAVRFDGGPPVGAGTTLGLVLAGTGASRVVAAGGAGGLAVTYWALRQGGEPRRRALVRVLGVNTLLYGVFGALALGAGVAALGGAGPAPRAMAATWVALVASCMAAAAWVTRPVRMRRLAEPGGKAGRPRRALGLAVAGVDMARRMARSPRVAGRAVPGAAVWWAGDLTCLWAGLRAVGVEVGLVALVLAYVTGYAATIVPLPTGGVGGVDAAMTVSLTAVGVPLDQALLGVVAYRLVAFWIPTVPALVALAGLPGIGRRLRQAAPRDASAPEPAEAGA